MVGAGVSRGGGSAYANASGRSKTANSFKDPLLEPLGIHVRWLEEGSGDTATGKANATTGSAAGTLSTGGDFSKQDLDLTARSFAGFAIGYAAGPQVQNASVETYDDPIVIDLVDDIYDILSPLNPPSPFPPIVKKSDIKAILKFLGLPTEVSFLVLKSISFLRKGF